MKDSKNKTFELEVRRFTRLTRPYKDRFLYFSTFKIHDGSQTRALFTSIKKSKNFQNSPSHRIFRRMHGVLNINKNKDELHSLVEIDKTNLLSLVST